MANNNNNAGSVTVRWAVQDEQVVRKALEQLGKDGDAALRKLDAASRTPAAGLKALGVAVGELKDRLIDTTTPIGAFGNVLRAVGPIGLGIAAVIGTLFLAFEKIKEGAKQFNQFAREVKDAGEAAGLSTTVYQTLLDVFQRHGVESEKGAAALAKFAAESKNAARGSGDLYDSLKRLDPALAERFAATTNQVERLKIFVEALARTTDTSTQAALGRAAFGRGSAGIVQSLVDLSRSAGGIDAVAAKLKDLGVVIDDAVIQKQALAAIAAERTAKIVERNYNQAYASIYNVWKNLKGALGLDADNRIAISVAFKFMVDNALGASDPASGARTAVQALEKQLENLDNFKGPSLVDRMLGNNSPEQIEKFKDLVRARLQAARDTLGEFEREGARFKGPQGAAAPTSSAEAARDAAERTLKTERERLAILGDMATAEEKIGIKRQELALTTASLSKAERAAILESTSLQLSQSETALRSKFALATEDQKRIDFEREFSLLVARGIAQEGERTEARRVFNRELKVTIEQEKVRRADFPQLKQFEVDSANLNRNLDQFGTTTSGNVVTALADISDHTRTAGDAFNNLGRTVQRAITEMILKMTVGRAVAMAFNSAFGLFGGAGSNPLDVNNGFVPNVNGGGIVAGSAKGNVFSGGRIIPFARGGIVRRPTLFPMANGGTGLAGEAGEEGILPLTRIGGKLGVHAVGGGAQVINNTIIENHGADVSEKSREQNSSGGVDIRLMVRSITDENLSSGKHNAALSGQGFRRSVGQRR